MPPGTYACCVVISIMCQQDKAHQSSGQQRNHPSPIHSLVRSHPLFLLACHMVFACAKLSTCVLANVCVCVCRCVRVCVFLCRYAKMKLTLPGEKSPIITEHRTRTVHRNLSPMFEERWGGGSLICHACNLCDDCVHAALLFKYWSGWEKSRWREGDRCL